MKYVTDEMVDRNVDDYFRIQDICSSEIEQIQNRFCDLMMNIKELEQFNNDFETMKWEVEEISQTVEHKINTLIAKYFV